MGMPDLTDRQAEILSFIVDRTRVRGYPPSVREIGQAMGLRSSSTVHGHLTRLEEKGYIKRDPSKPRAIEILRDPQADERDGAALGGMEFDYEGQRIYPVPLVGRVTAGEPILAVENIEEVFPLPHSLVEGRDTFMLTVRGDSMIEAGIIDGDQLLVRRQDTADNGDIVVAMLEEEATVKRFFRERDAVRLQPENPHMEPIYAEDVRVLGKVVGLFRRYH